jgi:SAM-dependent methyltransferase
VRAKDSNWNDIGEHLMKCRMCKSTRLYPFLDLGNTPLADQFKTEPQLDEPETYYPLKVVVCDDCGLAQLNYVVPREILFQNDYPYESSTTRTGKLHWEGLAKTVTSRFGLGADDLVVDIGSNVGVLLQAFKDCGTRVYGIDPARNIAEIANRNGIPTVCDFFGMGSIKKVMDQCGRAAVITGTNVFAHVHDLDTLVHTVKHLLRDSGVFVIEVPYFAHLVNRVEYDTIYHEHVSYISIKPLVAFFRRHGMEVFDIQEMPIHGGTIRVYIGEQGQHPAAGIVGEMLKAAEEMRLHSHATLDAFADAVRRNRDALSAMISRIRQEGKRIVAVSAPAKGMTLLNYCGLGRQHLDFITEKARLKIGKFSPGGHIPVVADQELLVARPDYALLLAWNFADEIIANLHEFRAGGGQFILPIPMPRIVS